MHESHPLRLLPGVLAHRYDPGHDAVHFIEAARSLRRRVPFLTDENLPGATVPIILHRSEALAAVGDRAAIAFIFHSAYCCSTLLANAFDRPGAAFSLKEPVLLNDLVGWRHRGGAPEKVAEVLGDALTLLARPFIPGEICVVKPSNVVNALAPAMMSARPEANALLLHAPLKVYLGSIAGKGLKGRIWVRDLMVKLLKDGMVDLGFEPDDHFAHTDLQVAAVGWLAQLSLFARVARTWPDRVRSLDSETLLARPSEALTALDLHFALPSRPAERDAIIADVFGRHSKAGHDFAATDRTVRQNKLADIHAEEIEIVVRWAREVADRAGVPLSPLLPLL